jgi:diguanylate cyclase (GGDEF)-like protein
MHSSGGILTAERVRKAVEALEVPFETGPIKFTVSAGVAELVPASGNWERMIQRADAAMYVAKKNGRNSVAVESPKDTNGFACVSYALTLPAQNVSLSKLF